MLFTRERSWGRNYWIASVFGLAMTVLLAALGRPAWWLLGAVTLFWMIGGVIESALFAARQRKQATGED